MRGLWELGESILEMEKGCGYREHGMLRSQRPVGWGAEREGQAHEVIRRGRKGLEHAESDWPQVRI